MEDIELEDIELEDIELEDNYNFKINYIKCINKNNSSEIVLLDEEKIKKINKELKKDNVTNTNIPIKENPIVLGIIENNNIASIIYIKLFKNKKFNIEIIWICYSYTFRNFRNKGYNKILRNILEEYCKCDKIDFIISIPFKDSYTNKILDNLNYKKSKNGIIRYKKFF